MKTETREIYKCDHCNKLYQIKSACERHEKRCKKNPEMISECHKSFCNHLDMMKVKVRHDYYEMKFDVNMLYCKKKQVFTYPLWVKNPILSEDIEDEIENIPMPKKCDLCDSNKII